MDFKHSRLGSTELRLLSVVPGTNERDLHFKVSHVPRDRAPPYTAVSYTWGDGQPTEVIHLNGRRFHIRLNLWSCLYYLSLYSRHKVWNHIWVDAICIDQANDSEKSVQVRAMDKTYRNAAAVSVWLGLVPLPEFLNYQTFGPGPIKTLDVEDFHWADSMAQLANNPYWTRFWVIQEFLLGGDVDVFCSGNCIDWQQFKEDLCRHAGVNEFSDVLDTGNNIAVDSTSALPLVMGRHIDRHPEFLQPLHGLLVKHRRSRCKNPRDRVFALLGLIPLDDRAMLQRFFPDYTLSEESVVIITLAHLLQFKGSGYDDPSIGPDSEDLFLGLGIESRKPRERLLKRAMDFDYLDEDAARGFEQRIAWRDELASAENGDLNESWEYDMTEVSGPSLVKRVTGILIPGLLLGAVIWWVYKVYKV